MREPGPQTESPKTISGQHIGGCLSQFCQHWTFATKYVQDLISQGLRLVFHSDTPPLRTSPSVMSLGAKPGLREQVQLNARKRSNRTGRESSFSRVLLQPIPSPEIQWGLASCHKLEIAQSLPGNSVVHDGNNRSSIARDSGLRLDGINRPHGRVLSHPSAQGRSKVHALCARSKRGVLLQGNALRSVNSSADIHPSGIRTGRPVTGSGNKNVLLFGRLACAITGQEPTKRTSGHGPGTDFETRVPHQLPKIGTNSLPGFHIPGGEDKQLSNGNQTRLSISNQARTSHSHVPQSQVLFNQEPPISDRLNLKYSEAHPPGKAPLETDSAISHLQMEIQRSQLARENCLGLNIQEQSRVVQGQEEHSRGGPDKGPPSVSPVTHGCLTEGLGMPSACGGRNPNSKRPLGCSSPGAAYQCSRVMGDSQGSDLLHQTSEGSGCSSPLRQHHSSELYRETRGYTFLVSDRHHVADPVLGKGERLCDPGKTHLREAQRPSRRSEPSRDHQYGMVSVSGDFQQSRVLSESGSNCGPICDSIEPEGRDLCLPISGSSSMDGGCFLIPLGAGGDGLRLSSNSTNRPGSNQDSGLSERDDFNRSVLASSTMVSQDFGTPNRTTLIPAEEVQHNFTGGSEQGQVLHGIQDDAPSRLGALRGHLQTEGFSNSAANRISQPIAESSSKVYDGRWRGWCDWCAKLKINPVNPSIPQVADFFVFLFEEEKMAISTITGYRSAMASVLHNRNVMVGENPQLTKLIRNFKRDRGPTPVIVPRWDLSIILKYMTDLEPLSSLSIENLTKKTLFLLAFASGRRRCELHALRSDEPFVSFGREFSNVSLRPDPKFIAKTQSASVQATEMLIPALIGSHLSDIDRSLCPVRSLRQYLSKTEPYRKGRNELFIHFDQTRTKRLNTSHISLWLKQTIISAYNRYSELPIDQPRAHEVRALAASWANFRSPASLDTIMKNAMWKSHSTFTQFYMRDVGLQSNDLYSMGPVVAAGIVINN